MNRVTEEKPETSRHKEKLLKYVFSMFETKIHAKVYPFDIICV